MNWKIRALAVTFEMSRQAITWDAWAQFLVYPAFSPRPYSGA